MKRGLALSLYQNSNLRFHVGNKVVIYQLYSTIECVMMRSIYFSFVFFYLYILMFDFIYRKCLSTIQFDVFQRNNVLIILISDNLTHRIFLFQHPLLYLLSKRVPNDNSTKSKYAINSLLCQIFSFLFLIDMCSYISLIKKINAKIIQKKKTICSFFSSSSFFYVFHIVHKTVDLSVHLRYFSFVSTPSISLVLSF